MIAGESVPSPLGKLDLSKKKKKRKIPEKRLSFRSTQFDTHTAFDIFDFVQFKTQMKILKLKAEERREGVQDLAELIAQIPSKKRKLKKPKSATVKISSKEVIKQEISEDDVTAFFKSNQEVKSHKRARAHIKAVKYIKEYLKRHPDIPVEKSHKSMKPYRNMQAHLQFSREKHLGQVSAHNLSASNNTGNEAKKNMTGQSAPGLESTQRSSESIDHVAAINSWIQKNYSSLSTTQKQLVHMQLQYLNNLKKTSFQNQAFILSPQHLNNLNNVGFLHANFNPFNSNYTNFVSIPSYSVDSGQSNMQMVGSVQQQQQQQQNSFRVQMPLSFLGENKEGNGATKNGSVKFGDSNK